ncbi:MAG: hypothetical protein KAS71_19610 [Bacteroidales bacterium]|nr:hypothetical protein [Bacteroidales bacterium]
MTSGNNNKKLILFGAGKIGRSFIGQLFSRGNYEVVFVDISKDIINELNKRKNYNVVIKSEDEELLNINNVRGIWAGDETKIVDEIADASIAAVSVGLNGLRSVIPIIAKGLLERYNKSTNNPLDIIIAENLRNAAEYLEDELKKQLPEWYPIENMVGLIETSIGKMVPIMLKKDMEEDVLQVFAEPYNTLILDANGFKNPIPKIDGLAPKENMKAWVDRKLFIHNLGHVCAAYYGASRYPDLKYIHEVLAHEEIYRFTREAMLQSSHILEKLYPSVFIDGELIDHIDDLLSRFCNKALGDTIFRVGCDLNRKLSSNDRLFAPFHAGIKLNLPVDRIINGIIFGTSFNAKDESGNFFEDDIKFIRRIKNNGLKKVLKEVGALDENEIQVIFNQLEKNGKSINLIGK